MTLYPNLILDALRTVRYPGNGKNIVDLGMVEDDMRIEGNRVTFSLIFDKPTDPFAKSLVKAAEAALLTHVSPDIDIRGNISVKFKKTETPKPATPLPHVSNIIAVSSGKGGVGKSTVASNLAVALARRGYSVGLLDADIFGPSIPTMFGLQGQPVYMEKIDGQDMMLPLESHGVKLQSIGLLVEPDSAILWRGAMASRALNQLITQVNWGKLDYLLIDMPPGTSDIHLSLVQTLPIGGAIVVSTPQEVALADARKGVSMFLNPQVNVPVLGIVENMAWFTPAPHPDERYYIFGRDGAVELAKKMGVSVLGQIPLVADICQCGDDGNPIASRDSITGEAFADLADRVVEAMHQRNASLPPTKTVDTH